jgi:hypothetical protein
MSRLTRREMRKWLDPMRKAFREMREGEVDSLQGYAVTRIDATDEFCRIDWAINGFAAVLERIVPDLDTKPLHKVSKRLANGISFTIADVDRCLALLTAAEDRLIKIPRAKIRAAVLAEQIDIELQSLGLKEAA